MDHVAPGTTSQRKIPCSSVSKLRNGTDYRYPAYGTVLEQINMNKSAMEFCQKQAKGAGANWLWLTEPSPDSLVFCTWDNACCMH
jgi:hypothetical protein